MKKNLPADYKKQQMEVDLKGLILFCQALTDATVYTETLGSTICEHKQNRKNISEFAGRQAFLSLATHLQWF